MNKQLEILQTKLACGEPQLENLLQRLHQLDKFAWHMNLLSNNDSMLEHLFTDEQGEIVDTPDEENQPHVTQRLTTALAEMIDNLEQHVSWVMQAMNRWCLTVLAWEFVLLAIVAAIVGGLTMVEGNGQAWPVLHSWWAELLARPISMTVYSVLVMIIVGLVHLRLRKKMAGSIATRLSRLEPFDTARAFLKNTRIRHSIYRPQPVGWASRAQRQLNELRKQLTDKVVHSTVQVNS